MQQKIIKAENNEIERNRKRQRQDKTKKSKAVFLK